MQQFDFAKHWRQKVVPLLNLPRVNRVLAFGLILQGDGYQLGEPPWLHGRGPINGQKARRGCLSWYQPWGCCHYIAPFAWAIGQELFPDLNWGFVTSDTHTVAIGYETAWEEPELVLDILLFQKKTAQESLDFAKSQGWKFYRTLNGYAASFSTDPESTLQLLCRPNEIAEDGQHTATK